ncbi:MAG: PLP-dependent transferase [Rhizobiales bacterium]|nr:PLP-dependent transferase [Hyphomicrobiales bacterium]
MKTRRRSFMQGAVALPAALTALVSGAAPAAAARGKRDLLGELNVRPFINAAGTYTTHSGSLMRPEVMEAINYASQYFVEVEELHNAVGKRVAALVGSEAAMVTAGAASALTLATAGVLTGTDRVKINQIPDLTGMKNEVIVQKAHRFAYDHGIRNTGVKMVEVTTRAELESAVNEKTAMLFFLNYANGKGEIKDAEFVEIGKKVNIPTFNDAAADVHPVENISKWVKMGFDLVCFSGGKGLMAPQSSGLLLGRADLIAAARANNAPSSATIGRGMKVNKEEMLGIMVALESFLERDHAKEWAEWERRVKIISDSITAVPGVKAEMYLPEIFNRWPHIRVTWDEAATGISRADVVQKMRAGEPSILVWTAENSLDLGVITLKPGEDRIVARRLKQELQRA